MFGKQASPIHPRILGARVLLGHQEFYTGTTGKEAREERQVGYHSDSPTYRIFYNASTRNVTGSKNLRKVESPIGILGTRNDKVDRGEIVFPDGRPTSDMGKGVNEKRQDHSSGPWARIKSLAPWSSTAGSNENSRD